SFFFQAEDGIRDRNVTGVQTCALPICGKLDTNVDGINSFYLVFDEESAQESNQLFYGKCAELCGPSHALMDFKVHALPAEEYDRSEERRVGKECRSRLPRYPGRIEERM